MKDFDFSKYPLYSTFGFGFDAGVTISLFDLVTISAAWNNFSVGTANGQPQKDDSGRCFHFVCH